MTTGGGGYGWQDIKPALQFLVCVGVVLAFFIGALYFPDFHI